jgi:putative colanic acid biosynthesis acetyltransferase WcaF
LHHQDERDFAATRPGSSCASGARSIRRLEAFTGQGYDKGRSKIWQVAWYAASNLAFAKWWMPARLRPALLRMFGAEIGENVLIRSKVRIHWPWKLRVGDNCWIGEGAWLLNLEPIHLHDNVCVSQEALICTGSHQHADPSFEFANAPITVGAGAWIAARAVVLAGSTVHEDELVACGVVRRPHRDIDPAAPRLKRGRDGSR